MNWWGEVKEEDGIKLLQSAVDASGPDPDALRWLYLAQAREAVEGDNEVAATTAYRRLLELDETNHEARTYVRAHGRKSFFGGLFGR